MYKFLIWRLYIKIENKSLIPSITSLFVAEMLMHSRRCLLDSHSNLPFLFLSSLLRHPRQTLKFMLLVSCFRLAFYSPKKTLNVRNVAMIFSKQSTTADYRQFFNFSTLIRPMFPSYRNQSVLQINSADQLTDFYMMGTLIIKRLKTMYCNKYYWFQLQQAILPLLRDYFRILLVLVGFLK